MSKFNVGDKVSWTKYDDCWQDVEITGIVECGEFKGEYYVNCPKKGQGVIRGIDLKLSNRSPIRTVTRREIVPGVYGALDIDSFSRSKVFVGLRTECGNRYVHMNATELREAAQVLNQLAEVLEDV